MAALPHTCNSPPLNTSKLPKFILSSPSNCSFPRHSRFASQRITKSSRTMYVNRLKYGSDSIDLSVYRDLVAARVSPDAADDLVSSLTHLASDNPWIGAIAVLFVAVPSLRKLLLLTKQVDETTRMMEEIAATVKRSAADVDRARDDIAKSLLALTTGLKKAVTTVEFYAKNTLVDADKIDDLSNKVEEVEKKLDGLLGKQFNGTGEP